MAYTDRTIPTVAYSERSVPSANFVDRDVLSDSYGSREVLGSFLAQQTSIFDLILQEDGGKILLSLDLGYDNRTVPTAVYTDR
jgi:hypothetical protein